MALRPMLMRLQSARLSHAQQPAKILQQPSILYRVTRHNLPQLQASVAQKNCLHTTSIAAKKKNEPSLFVTMSLDQQVQVLSYSGDDLGMMTKIEAENMARAENLHLMIVEDLSKLHPVFKILSGHELVEEQKRERLEKKAHPKHKEKTVKLASKIMEHDLNIRIQQARKMLQKDISVVVVVQNSTPGKEKVCMCM